MKFNFHENHRLLFSVVFFGFALLTVIIAVSPAVWVQEHTDPLPGSRALAEEERRGLHIYIAEGCPYCHTQQVRPLDVDKPFGRPSAPGDYARLKPQDMWRMTPALLGTERTGPDLSDVAERQPSAVWHFIHLFNPRAVVKESIMQAYPWFFTKKNKADPNDILISLPPDRAPAGGVIVATQAAKDLVAYLLTLKQVPVQNGGAGPIMVQPEASGRPSDRGALVYASHCASCHGASGEGVPGIFPPMRGDAVVTSRDPARHIRVVLFGLTGETIGGVRYSAAMPSHEQELSDADIAAVINHERSSWGNNAPSVTVEDVVRARKAKKG